MSYRLVSIPLCKEPILVRLADNAHIPADPLNTDWQAYQAWLKAGNKPEEPKPIKDR